MATGTCLECGQGFTYRLRGRPQVVCGEACKLARVRRQTAARVDAWAMRRAQAAAERATAL
ncbi:MAG: hypothetical protein U0869_25455 [Chloroflexota bacterium]